MSKLQLKIKDHDNNFIVLNNIRNLIPILIVDQSNRRNCRVV
nr:hypothetical protein [Wolbachia endosymbiont (group A) of Sicus ferrugineus]